MDGPGRALLVAAGLLLTAAGADAAIRATSTSTITTSVTSSPVLFASGDGASKSRYVTTFTLSPGHTSFAAKLSAKSGGAETVKDVVRLVSGDSATRTITLRATQVSNANVLTFTWTVKDGSATVATLDLKTANPSATFTLPAGATFKIDLKLTLAAGVGNDNAATSFSMGASAS